MIGGAVAVAVTALALLRCLYTDLNEEITRDAEYSAMWNERIMDETDGSERA